MAFKLAKNRRVKWPVTIEVPIDGGDTESQTCTAEFDLLAQEEYDKLANDKLANNDIKFLVRVVTGFGDDIQDEEGKPLECTDKNKRALFQSAGYVRMGFLNAYHEAVTGIKAKNFKGRPATGRKDRKPRKKT